MPGDGCRQVATDKRPIPGYFGSVASAQYEARRFASMEQAIDLATCLAVIVKPFFTRAMAGLSMKFHKPPYPTRVFNDEKAALAWLETFLQDVARVSDKHQ